MRSALLQRTRPRNEGSKSNGRYCLLVSLLRSQERIFAGKIIPQDHGKCAKHLVPGREILNNRVITGDAAKNTTERSEREFALPPDPDSILHPFRKFSWIFFKHRRLERCQGPRLLAFLPLFRSSVCFFSQFFVLSFALLMTHHPQALFITLDSGSHDSFVSNLRIMAVGHRRYKQPYSRSHYNCGPTSRKQASLLTIVCHIFWWKDCNIDSMDRVALTSVMGMNHDTVSAVR